MIIDMKILKEENEEENAFEVTERPTIEEWVEKTFGDEYVDKVIGAAIDFITASLEYANEDGTIEYDDLWEYCQFADLEEIFDYIRETGDTNFKNEISNGADDLYGIYTDKVYDAVSTIVWRYNEDYLTGNYNLEGE